MPLWFWLVGFAAILLIIAMISYFFYTTRPIPTWIWLLLFFAIIILIIALLVGLLLKPKSLSYSTSESPSRERPLISAEQTPSGQPLPIPLDPGRPSPMFTPSPMPIKPHIQVAPVAAPIIAPVDVPPMHSIPMPSKPPMLPIQSRRSHRHKQHSSSSSSSSPSSSSSSSSSSFPSSSSSSSTIDSSTDSSISYDFSIEKEAKIGKECKPKCENTCKKKYNPPARLR